MHAPYQVPRFSVNGAALPDADVDLIVIPVAQDHLAAAVSKYDGALGDDLRSALERGEFGAKPHEIYVARMPASGWRAARVVLVGGGPRGDINVEQRLRHRRGTTTSEAAGTLPSRILPPTVLLIVDPFVKVSKNGAVIAQPASARVAGLQARVDYDEGFWFSPSNHVLEGIVGTARTVEHSLSDPSAELQYLNRNAVATVVRSPSGGFKLWGSRVPSGDSLKLFWSVRRSHDAIIESIERAHEPFIDRPFNIQILLDIAETVNSALRRWKALGATLGGRVWLDRTINTPETWAAGHIYVSYDAEAPAPMEHITFVFNRNTGYYEELAEDALREIARLSGRTL